MLYLRYGIWKLKNRHKYLLQYHIIWGRKYSKKLLASKQISDDIKQFSYEICQNGKKYPNYLRKHFWKCNGRDAKKVYRESRLREKVTVNVKSI